MKGKICQWKDEKGFGFIQPENGGEKLFFHISFTAHVCIKNFTNIIYIKKITKFTFLLHQHIFIHQPFFTVKPFFSR